MFLIQINRQTIMFSEMKILQCTPKDEVFNCNDVIRIARRVLNIESTKPVAILTFEWTL